MFISAAALKQISNLKIVHKPVTKAAMGGFPGPGDTPGWVAAGVDPPAPALRALLLPPTAAEPVRMEIFV